MTKKCLISFLTYILFSGVCLVSMHLTLLADASKFVGVMFGLLLLTVGLAVYFAVRAYLKEQNKREYGLLAFLPISAIGSGLTMSSLYTHRGAAPTLLQSSCVWGAYVLLFLAYCLLANIPFFRRHPYICIGIFGVGLLVGEAVALGLASKTMCSLLLMTAVLFLAFLATVLVHSQNFSEHCRYLALVSFVVLAVVIVVVLLVISGGEIFDGPSVGGDLDNAYKYPKYNPYAFYDAALALAAFHAMQAATQRGAEAIEHLRVDDIEATLNGGLLLAGKKWLAVLVVVLALCAFFFVGFGASIVDALVFSVEEYTKGEVVAVTVLTAVFALLIVLLAFVTKKWHDHRKKVAAWLEDAVVLTARTGAYAEGGNKAIALEVAFEYNGEPCVKRSNDNGKPRYLYAYRSYVGNKIPVAYSPKYDEVMLISARSLNDPHIYGNPEGETTD